MNEMSYVWYFGYGSNLSKQRFICYIVGGTPRFGKRYNNGCSNTDCPVDEKPFRIPYCLYFALPEGKEGTNNWGPGGVAFIDPNEDPNKNKWTWGRMWKITIQQYNEVKEQEGPWYKKEIPLGFKNDIPIYTITNEKNLKNILFPSEKYLKTIVLGLMETYNFNNEEIAEYLITADGINGQINKNDLIEKIKSLSDFA